MWDRNEAYLKQFLLACYCCVLAQIQLHKSVPYVISIFKKMERLQVKPQCVLWPTEVCCSYAKGILTNAPQRPTDRTIKMYKKYWNTSGVLKKRKHVGQPETSDVERISCSFSGSQELHISQTTLYNNLHKWLCPYTYKQNFSTD